MRWRVVACKIVAVLVNTDQAGDDVVSRDQRSPGATTATRSDATAPTSDSTSSAWSTSVTAAADPLWSRM